MLSMLFDGCCPFTLLALCKTIVIVFGMALFIILILMISILLILAKMDDAVEIVHFSEGPHL